MIHLRNGLKKRFSLHCLKVAARLINHQTRKVMKTTIKIGLVLMLAALVWSCDTREREMLASKVDSLQVELITSKKNVETLQEIGALIDSIDASREMLRTNAVEGTSFSDYSTRLDEINNYIRETRSKIEELEKSIQKNASQYAASLNRLKKELEQSSLQVAALQSEVENMQAKNQELTASLSEKEIMINDQVETIKLKEENILSLETRIADINLATKTSQADLYFAQAQALEIAADRTKFAPKKKKETQREALELYRMSHSLGKMDALDKINQLEKELG
jgi:chromosome segregation ATPase